MKFYLALLLSIPFSLFSQSDFSGYFYFNASYGPAVSQSKDAFLLTDASKSPIQHNSYQSASGTLLQLETSLEYIGDNFYVYSDPGLSWAVSSLLYRFPRALLTEEPFKFQENEINSFEFEPLRFNVGGWINDNLGLFAGAQYSFVVINANEEFVKSKRESENPDIIRSINGGNARGIGAHAFYQLNKFLFQYSFMYNWVANSKKANTGIGIHQEARVRFGDESFGALACVEHNIIRMNQVTHSEPIDISSYATYSSREGVFPSTTGSIFWLRLGLYFTFDY